MTLNLTTIALAAAAAVMLAGPMAGTAYAQAMDHANMPGMKMTAVANAAMSDGEVHKIDKGNLKVTLKHGELKNLGMPAMTMVFKVKDAAMLDGLQVGSRVKFVAEHGDGALVLMAIERVK